MLSNKVTITVKKITPVLGSSIPVLGMKVKQGKGVIWLFMKMNLSTTISMKRSRRELSIDMVIQRGIYKNKHITHLPCSTSISKKGLVFTGMCIFLLLLVIVIVVASALL